MCFVYNQKTAYEMRISDWSSDVCSSDLKVGTTCGTMAYRMTFAGDAPVASSASTGRRSISSIASPRSLPRKPTDLNIMAMMPASTPGPKLDTNKRAPHTVITERLDTTIKRRSDVRRVGEECVRACRLRGSPEQSK